MASYRACELCGSPDPRFLLTSERLDGPLVRCGECGLVFVGIRGQDFTFSQPEPAKSALLARRVRELGLLDCETEQAEARWRRLIACERVRDLQLFQSHGRLLEIGCAEGIFLSSASEAGFQSVGLEADPETSSFGRSRGLDIRTGTLESTRFEPEQFHVVAMYHVIEHLDSPRRTLDEVARILVAGGLLALETPNVDTLWFKLLRRRWRQLIPDHYFFFSPRTIRRLLEKSGFEICRIRTASKPMSLRLFLDRVRRFNSGLGQAGMAIARVTHAEDFTLRLNLGDIMRVHARRRP